MCTYTVYINFCNDRSIYSQSCRGAQGKYTCVTWRVMEKNTLFAFRSRRHLVKEGSVTSVVGFPSLIIMAAIGRCNVLRAAFRAIRPSRVGNVGLRSVAAFHSCGRYLLDMYFASIL